VGQEDQATTDLPETVSREAHQRMTDERNDLKAQVQDLSTTVTDLAFADKARKHFVEKGVSDPDWAAEIALPSIKSDGTEIGDLGGYLDDKFARLYPSETDSQPSSEGTDDGVPTPDAVEPPGFARPSPAQEGAPPGQQKYTISSPEVQAIINANDREGLEKMDKAGLIEWHTESPVTPG
jgi:hypothetical protein